MGRKNHTVHLKTLGISTLKYTQRYWLLEKYTSKPWDTTSYPLG